MKPKKITSLFIVLILLLIQVNTFAQCAMCKASAESDLKNGGSSIATGLNTGILYLMGIPYIILMIGGYFFFKKPIDAKIKAWKEKKFPSKQTG